MNVVLNGLAASDVDEPDQEDSCEGNWCQGQDPMIRLDSQLFPSCFLDEDSEAGYAPGEAGHCHAGIFDDAAQIGQVGKVINGQPDSAVLGGDDECDAQDSDETVP